MYLCFIKSPSWILAGLWNCMLSKEEGLKITKEKRLMRRKGKQDKSRPEKGRNKWLYVGMSLSGGSRFTCWFTEVMRN